MTVYLICGGRDFADYRLLKTVLNDRPVTAIGQGGAKGADRMAKAWATKRGIPVIQVDANWLYYGKSAGHLRNGWMLEFARVDAVVAFPGGRGTASMVKTARALSIPVKETS